MPLFEEVNQLLSPYTAVQSIMSQAERRYIWDCVASRLGEPVLEVGSAYGGTTILMALAGASRVFSVDDWSCGKRQEFEGNLVTAGIADRVEVIAARSIDVAQHFEDRSMGVVLIDGDHTGEMPYLDLCLYAPKVAPGGWLLIDDTANGYDDITNGLERWLHTADAAQFEKDQRLYMDNTPLPKLLGLRRRV